MSNLTSVAPKITNSGSYSGNSTQNRAVAHGIPGNKTPGIVFVFDDVGGVYILNATWILSVFAGTPVIGPGNQTAMDTSNFYVGTAAVQYYANLTGRTYTWIAVSI
jgi:hypothetical protein